MHDPLDLFCEPVNELKEILGNSFKREHSGLSRLCSLLQIKHPKKIVKVSGSNSSTTLTVLRCMDMLHLSGQLYIVDSSRENFLYTKDVFDLKKELERSDFRNYRIFSGCTLAACLDEIGDEIDLLILDAAETMPSDLLDFIVAFPYLSSSAMVALCGTFPKIVPQNILFQNVIADKFSTYLKKQMDIQDCIQWASVDAISVFQINTHTAHSLPDLFGALRCRWPYILPLQYLLEYESSIKAHYPSGCWELYKQAILEADPAKKILKSMLNSLQETFPQLLLYGKGKRGIYFLKLSRLLNIRVTGFVVSNGRGRVGSYEGLPVYLYSEIPFSKDNVFILQTAKSEEIEQLLRKSVFHWMRLPEYFWTECDYGNAPNV